MARGWESKSVEDQQQEAARGRTRGEALTPEQQQRAQRKATLALARARTETDLGRATGNYADMLRKQLAAIDQQIAALDE